ncbi:MAG: DUF302 domain-containing protein [Pseudomonadota bacterium]
MYCKNFFLVLISFVFTSFVISSPSIADTSSVVKTKSPFKALETLERIEGVIGKRGLKVFNRIDHASAAQDYGKSMPPSWVVIFGNPKVGTGFMLKSPASAIDFPLKGLVYEDAEGSVWFAYNTSEHMKLIFERHGLSGKMDWYEKLMASIVAEAFKK